MFGPNHYLPILKGKAGEFGALRVLSNQAKRSLTPLIDVPRVTLEYPQRVPKQPLEKHLAKVAKNLLLSWGLNRVMFVDLSELELADRTSTGSHPMTCIFDWLRKNGVKAIPTTGFDRDADYNAALRDVVRRDCRGVMIRIQEEDIGSPEDLDIQLDELLQLVGVRRDNAHLLLDFRGIKDKSARTLAKLAINTINDLSQISKWQTLTLAASGLPESMSEVQRDNVTRIERKELKLWRLVAESDDLARIPTFGDYGVVHPDFVERDPRAISVSAKIRYTLDEDWLILKGHSLKKYPKYAQDYGLAGSLVRKSGYRGYGYSWGNSYAAECAVQASGTGSLETWVKVDTSHHLTLVAEQISTEAVV